MSKSVSWNETDFWCETPLMSTADNVWNLISSGDLFTDEKLAELQAEFTRVPPGQSNVLDWLVSQGEITDYHCQVFKAGHSGPFRYGDYTVKDRITEGYFNGGFRAVHSATGHPVILSFVSGEDSEKNGPG